MNDFKKRKVIKGRNRLAEQLADPRFRKRLIPDKHKAVLDKEQLNADLRDLDKDNT